MTNDTIRAAFIQAFEEAGRCGSLDAAICHRVCEIIECDPWQLTAALDANDDELRIEIALVNKPAQTA